MDKKPVVSVVMPVYNGDRYLQEAINSILNQDFGDFEFIIINDASTDATPAILARYEKLDSRIHVYHNQKNAGAIISLIRGCDSAVGKYIALLDCDDIAFPGRFKQQVDFLERNPHIALLGTAAQAINSDGRPFKIIHHPQKDKQIKDVIFSRCPFTTSTVMMRRCAFDDVNGFRKIFWYAGDYDLWLRLAGRYEVANLPEPLSCYRVHNNHVSTKDIKQQTRAMLVAQVSARIKRQTGCDPLDNTYMINSEILAEAGVTDEEIDEAIIGGYRWWVTLLIEAGCENSALQLAKEAVNYSCSKPNQTKALSRIYILYARIYYKQGKLFHSVLSVLKAIFARPVPVK